MEWCGLGKINAITLNVPPASPTSYTEHDVIQYRISFGSVGVSNPSVSPPNSPHTPNSLGSVAI